MTELQFLLSLYSPNAINQAVEAFGDYADIERQTSDGVEVVRLVAKDGEDESLIAGELANYVLGATVDAVEPVTAKEE